MRIEDVRDGMKVVPHDKTYGRDFSAWASNSPRHKRFLDEHGFLLVECVYFYDGTCSLFDGIDDESRNSVFRSSDFTPAEIEVGDEVRVGDVLWGGSSWVARYNGKIGIVEAATSDMLGVRMPDDGYVAATRAVAILVRKAHCIKPEAAKEPEPKAPETVRLAWVRRFASDDLHLYKVPDGANVEAGDTVLTPPQGVKLRGVVEEVRTVSKADAAFMLRGQQPMVVPFLVGKIATETKEVLFDD